MGYDLPILVFLGAAFAASVFDLRSRRIPNGLTYGALAVVLLARAWFGGPFALVPAVLAALVVFVVGSFLFGRGWIGGGDVKLLAVGAAAFGFPAFLTVLAVVALSGGFLAVGFALRERRLRSVVGSVARSAATMTPIVPSRTARRLPYAIAIAAGSCLYVASGSLGPWLHLAH